MKRSKYNSVKSTLDGKTFDSRKEMKRYAELKLLEKAGEISGLQTQIKFVLFPNIYHNGITFNFSDGKCIKRSESYIADFVYSEHGKMVVEDCKGYRTALYNRKKNQMKKLYGIEIKES